MGDRFSKGCGQPVPTSDGLARKFGKAINVPNQSAKTGTDQPQTKGKNKS